MSNQNNISVVGTVATEPRIVVTQAGVKLCTFRLASGERRYDRTQQKWIDGETNWFSVAAFRMLAEHACQSFSKGERVIVSGRLRVRQWERDEKNGTSVEIEADALGHDLRWGVSRFERSAVSETSGERGSWARSSDEEAANGDSDVEGGEPENMEEEKTVTLAA